MKRKKDNIYIYALEEHVKELETQLKHAREGWLITLQTNQIMIESLRKQEELIQILEKALSSNKSDL
jgi:hypothetical protein